MGDPTSSLALFCKICRVPCTSVENLKQHLQGAKHLKKMRQESMLSAAPYATTPLSELMTQPIPTVAADSLDFSCKVCQTVMSGPEAYSAHMVGQKHAKKLRQQEMMKDFQSSQGASSVAGIPLPEVAAAEAREDSDMQRFAVPSSFAAPSSPIRDPVYFCQLCQAPLSGPESAKQHYDGMPHLKRVKQSKLSGDSAVDSGSVIEGLSQLNLDEKELDIIEIGPDENATDALRVIYREEQEEPDSPPRSVL